MILKTEKFPERFKAIINFGNGACIDGVTDKENPTRLLSLFLKFPLNHCLPQILGKSEGSNSPQKGGC